MNRSGIEWCDHTWNPITGCLHGCPYCYARKMSVRFSGDIKRNKAAVNDYRLQQTPDGKNLYILDQAMLSETGILWSILLALKQRFIGTALIL